MKNMIKARAILAPMAGVADIPFRLMARKFGCRFAFTEMIDSNGVAYNNKKTFQLMEKVSGDEPLGVQIVGEDPERLLNAAKLCEDRGFEVLDINAGCPARKVVSAGKGAALLKDPHKLSRIIGRIVGGVHMPVTVKIRSGWDEDNLNYLEVAKMIAGEGASAICVHPRTKDQMHKGRADHDIIRRVKEEVNIPVFASGNIFSARDAADVLANTGCDAVFVARGALGRPWIFREIYDHLGKNDRPAEASFDMIKETALEHFELCLQHYGEDRARSRMYKHVMWYMKKFKNIDAVMKRYRGVSGLSSFRDLMERLRLDERNRLFVKS